MGFHDLVRSPRQHQICVVRITGGRIDSRQMQTTTSGWPCEHASVHGGGRMADRQKSFKNHQSVAYLTDKMLFGPCIIFLMKRPGFIDRFVQPLPLLISHCHCCYRYFFTNNILLGYGLWGMGRCRL